MSNSIDDQSIPRTNFMLFGFLFGLLLMAATNNAVFFVLGLLIGAALDARKDEKALNK